MDVGLSSLTRSRGETVPSFNNNNNNSINNANNANNANGGDGEVAPDSPAKQRWKKAAGLIATTSWLVGAGKKAKETRESGGPQGGAGAAGAGAKRTAREKREEEYLEQFAWDPAVLPLFEKWATGLDPHFEPKRAPLTALVERIFDLSRVCEKLMLEKQDLYQQLESQDARFRDIESDRGGKVQDALEEVEQCKAECQIAEQRWKGLEGRLEAIDLEVQGLRCHAGMQRAALEKLRRVPPPLGEVTVVFMDVSGAKELYSDLGEVEGLAMTNTLVSVLRGGMVSLGGYEVKALRDAFMVVFDNPVDAVCFAGSVQLQLVSAPWSPLVLAHPLARAQMAQGTSRALFRGPRLRIGMHTGMPKIVQGGKVVEAKGFSPDAGSVDYVGTTVLRAARIQAAAHGGQTLLSDSTKMALRNFEGSAIKHLLFEDLGDFQLKELKAAERLHSMIPAELKGRFFAPPVCDLPSLKVASEAMDSLSALVAGFRTSLDSAKAIHQTTVRTSQLLAVRLNHTRADYTNEPRVLLKGVSSELDQLNQLMRQSEAKLEAEERAKDAVLDRLAVMEKVFKRLVPTISSVPKLKALLDQGDNTARGLIEAHRLDKEQHLREVAEMCATIAKLRAQMENTKILVREVKLWWRREELSVNPKAPTSTQD